MKPGVQSEQESIQEESKEQPQEIEIHNFPESPFKKKSNKVQSIKNNHPSSGSTQNEFDALE
jgi:hypothetical protein